MKVKDYLNQDQRQKDIKNRQEFEKLKKIKLKLIKQAYTVRKELIKLDGKTKPLKNLDIQYSVQDLNDIILADKHIINNIRK